MGWGPLASLVLASHALFVAFAVFGGLLARRWPRLPWLHLPAVAWAAWIEWSGGVCPLTRLENALYRRAGQSGYEGDFVGEYLLPVLYPAGLTREVQWLLGGLVLAANLGIYAWVLRRPRPALP